MRKIFLRLSIFSVAVVALLFAGSTAIVPTGAVVAQKGTIGSGLVLGQSIAFAMTTFGTSVDAKAGRAEMQKIATALAISGDQAVLRTDKMVGKKGTEWSELVFGQSGVIKMASAATAVSTLWAFEQKAGPEGFGAKVDAWAQKEYGATEIRKATAPAGEIMMKTDHATGQPIAMALIGGDTLLYSTSLVHGTQKMAAGTGGAAFVAWKRAGGINVMAKKISDGKAVFA